MRSIKTTRKWLAFLLTVTLLVSGLPLRSVSSQAQSQEITVSVDGVKVQFDSPPVVVNGRTMVPLRAIFEAMGAEVDWVGTEQMARAVKDDTTVCLHLNSLYPTINNEVRKIDATAVIVNNRTLAPLRFVGEAFGGTVTWNGTTRTVNIYTRDDLYHELPKTDLDFSIGAGDLALYEEASPSRTYVRPGVTLRLKVRVSKGNPTVEGGGKVMVTLGDLPVDTLPFYMDKTDDTLVFYKSWEIPMDLALGANPILKAVIEPDRLVRDTNATNNQTQVPVILQPPTNPESDGISDSRIASLKVQSEFGTGVAKSGHSLSILAMIKGTGQRTLVSYEINGHQVDIRGVTPSASGTATQLTSQYHVPWENNGLLRVGIRLDNGDSAFLPVRVLPFEYSVLPGGINWQNKSNTMNYRAGETLALSAKILRDNRNSFTDNFGALRAHFLINGQLSPGLSIDPPSGTAPYLGDVYYSYPVPVGQTGPLQVQLLVDAGGLLREEREDNNAVTVVIPETITGTVGNDLSVTAASLRYAPTQMVPGEKIELIATIHNGSATIPSAGVKVLFKINGEAINASDTAKPASYFKPGQSYTTCKVWTVPQNTTGDLTFSVELDPERRLAGDKISDNTATGTILAGKPDLLVETNSMVISGNLVSGGEGRLKARIYNIGAMAAENVETQFLINGAETGRTTIDLPAYGMLEMSVPFPVPSLPSVSDATVFSAVSGYVTDAADFKSITAFVRIDPDNAVAERDETNNLAGPKSMSVLVPATKGTVFAKAEDLDENKLSGVSMTLVAGGGSISGVTGADGWCTFRHVPYGPYAITADKTGHQQATTVDARLLAGNRLDHVTLFMDNRSSLSGTVSGAGGTPLSDVRVENLTSYSTQRTGTDGRYSLRLPAGVWTFRYSRKGYATVTETITLEAGRNLDHDKTMVPSTRYAVSGTAVDAQEVPIAGLNVQLIDGVKNVLASTTTDAAGFYRMEANLAQEEMWIGITATHGGAKKTWPGYVCQGAEDVMNLSWVVEPEPVSGAAGGACHVAPYVVCASMPGTFWSPDYEVEAIYGMFDLSLFTTVENGVLTYVEVDTTPQWWVSATVSSSWDPAELLGYDELVPGYDILSALLPLSVPLAVNMHSTNRTMVRVRKVSVVSGGREVYAAWPDAIGDYACAPNTAIDWNNCRIKLYLKADPDNGVVNPAAGYNLDRVLVEFNPGTKKFMKIGNYQVIGWDEKLAREIFMDE